MNFLFKLHNFFPVIFENLENYQVSETVNMKNLCLEFKYRPFMIHGLVSQDLYILKYYLLFLNTFYGLKKLNTIEMK